MKRTTNPTAYSLPDQSHRLSNRQGFTLIELLTVIAIVAVLAALIFPVFRSIRSKADASACQANLRIIGTAMNMYVADHNGSLIPALVNWVTKDKMYSSDNKQGGFWYTILDPYVNPGIDEGPNRVMANKRDVWLPKDRAIYAKWQLCPAKDPKMLGLSDDHKTVGYGWNNTGFGSVARQGGHSSANGEEFTRLAQVEKPSDTIIIGDSKDTEDSQKAYQNQYLYKGATAEGIKIRAERHSGGGNYLFVDGHIEWLTPEQLGKRIDQGVFNKIKDQ